MRKIALIVLMLLNFASYSQRSKVEIIESPTVQKGSLFGQLISASTNFIAVAQPEYIDSLTGHKGAVHIYKNGQDLNELELIQTITCPATASDDSKFAKYAILITDEFLFVSAYEQSVLVGSNLKERCGVVHQYCFYPQISQFVYKTAIKPRYPQMLNGFGRSISLDGNTLVIGADKDNHSPSGGMYTQAIGSVQVFERLDSVSFNFNFKTMFNAPANYLQPLMWFGTKVKVIGDYFYVLSKDKNSTQSYTPGAIYCFQRTNGVWSYSQRISSINANNGLINDVELEAYGDWLCYGYRDNNGFGIHRFMKYNAQSGVWQEKFKINEVTLSTKGRVTDFINDNFYFWSFDGEAKQYSNTLFEFNLNSNNSYDLVDSTELVFHGENLQPFYFGLYAKNEFALVYNRAFYEFDTLTPILNDRGVLFYIDRSCSKLNPRIKVREQGDALTVNGAFNDYKWFKGDFQWLGEQLNNETDSLFYPQENSYFFAEVLDDSNCWLSSWKYLYDIYGVDETVDGFQVNIYPNPASDEINIQSEIGIEKVQIINLSGQIVLETTDKNISVGHLPKSIYTIVVFGDKQNQARKFVFR